MGSLQTWVEKEEAEEREEVEEEEWEEEEEKSQTWARASKHGIWIVNLVRGSPPCVDEGRGVVGVG